MITWSSPESADPKSSELVIGNESGFPEAGRAPFDFGSVSGTIAFEPPAKSSMEGESPTGFILPPSDKVIYSGSRARADTGVDPWMGSDDISKMSLSCRRGATAEGANPSKIKSSRILVT